MKIWRSRTINEVHSEEKSQVILGSLVLLLFAGILFMRSFYSFSWSDESLYMAEVHRLYLGERPFVDEWHPTQFYAVLLLPFYRVYVWIKGTTEGIYFASRIFNLLLAFMAAESTYYVLKKYFELENWLSVAGGTIILLYSRANVGGISYHNFFFFCFIIAEMLLYIGLQCHRAKKNSLVFVVLSGISGAVGGAAMIAIPTCVFGIGIIYIAIIIYAIKTKTIKKFTPIWIHIAGILLLGTMYCIFVFSKITFIDFINMFQYLFMDESHQRKGIVDVMNNVWWVVIFYGKNILVVAGLLFIMKIILRLFHKATDEKLKAVAYVIVVMIGTLSLYQLSDSHMSAYVIFAFTGIGLLIIDESITKNILFTGSDINYFLIIPALVIALTFILASATIDPAYGGGALLGLVNLLIISKFIQSFSVQRYKIIVNCMTVVMISALIGMLLWVRVFTVYRDAPIKMLDTVITKGPAKGLWTTREHVEQYNACLDVMDYVNSLENRDDDKILVSVLAPWMYVCTDVQNGAISPWRIYLDEPLMEEYYQFHEIEKLKYIIVLNEDMGGYMGAGNPEGTDYKPNKNNAEGFLYDYLCNNLGVRKEFECGTLYMKD